MAAYPKQFIEKLNAQCSKEGWPIVGSFIVAMIVTAVLLYIAGEIVNGLP